MPLHDFSYVCLPYCLEKRPDGTYAVLNREKRSLGFIKWNDSVTVPLKGITPTKASKLSYEGNNDTDCIYLYNDGCVPTHSEKYMQDYLNRLKILAKLKMDLNHPFYEKSY